MSLCDKIRSGRFIVTSEIGPPKGTDLTQVIKGADLFKDKIDAVNVTDLQSSVMKVGSLAVCRILKERGIEPVFQLTCRDRNRLALQSELLSASVLGIENLLLLTGDYTTLGDHPEAKPVFDLDAVQLIEVARKLQGGTDMKGNVLKGSPKFCIGAVVNPGADPLEPELIKMEKKIEAGADFFQTQAVYDIDIFKKFIEETKHMKANILAGIVILKSANMARYMNKNIAGVFVPDELIREMESAKDPAAKSIEIAARIITQIKPLCHGIHIMPIGMYDKVPVLIDSVGL